MSYIYLASPYTGTPAEMEDRYQQVLEHTAWMLNKRIWVYSPIVHCHLLALRYSLPKTAGYWKDYNYNMLVPAIELRVLKLDGWESSAGITNEVDFADELDMPVTYTDLKRSTPSEEKLYKLAT